MDYLSQLQRNEWKMKRQVILKRDTYSCQNCLNHEYSQQFKGEIAEFCYESENKNVYNLIDGDCEWVYTTKKLTENKRKIFVYFEKKDDDKNYVNYTAIRKVNSHDYRVLRYKDKVEDLKRIKSEHEETTKIFNDLKDKNGKQISKSLFKMLFKTDLEEFEKYADNNFQPRMKDPNLTGNSEPYEWLEVKNLHIHHKYYQNGLHAWEYPDNALITLCWFCHEKLHPMQEIEIRDENGKKISTKKPCKRCFGAGYFPEFNHVHNGICFRCNGNKFEE